MVGSETQDPDVRHSDFGNACQSNSLKVEASKDAQARAEVDSMVGSETQDPDVRHSDIGNACQSNSLKVEASKDAQARAEVDSMVGSETQDPDVRHSDIGNACQSISLKVEASKDAQAEVESSDVEIQIVNRIISENNNKSVFKVEHQDTTESSSSSFGDAFVDGDATNSYGESELNVFDDFNSRRKKKQLTDDWRSFVRPIAWRCKWAELQMRKIQSIGNKCDNELEKYRQRKQSLSENIMSEECCSKSFPSTRGDNNGNEIMRRRKRRRIEETEDVGSYMSRHNLFSYYAAKKKRGSDDGWGCEAILTQNMAMDVYDELGNKMLPVEIRNQDNYVEHLMRMIRTQHIKVKEMKNRINILAIISADVVDILDVFLASNTFDNSSDNLKTPHNIEKETKVADADHIIDIQPKPEEVSNAPNQIKINNDQPKVKQEIVVYNRRPKKPKIEEKVNTRPVRKHKPPKFFDEIETTTPSSKESSKGKNPSPKIKSIATLTDASNNTRKKSTSRNNRSKRKVEVLQG